MKITVDGVEFTYPGGSMALNNVSLRIDTGEAVAIIGENGAGKTTLAKHLNGLLKPDKGSVLIGEGDAIWDTRTQSVAKMAARIGYVFQNPDDQILERTVRNEVAFGPRNLGRSAAELTAAVDKALAMVDLVSVAAVHPYDLTASQRKLVTLASVLAMETPVVIFDEPTLGQDARSVDRIGHLIESLKVEGRTLIIITHDIDFCAAHFERIVVMAGGRVLIDGPAEQVLSQTSLLATTNVEPPQLVRLAQALGLSRAPLTIDGFVAGLTSQNNSPRNRSA